MAMGKLINKKCVMVGNCDGFVGNRMARKPCKSEISVRSWPLKMALQHVRSKCLALCS